MPFGRRSEGSRAAGCGARLLVGLVIAGASLVAYWSSREFNPFTGEKQAVAYTQEQEVALGLQAAPEMAVEMGGEDPSAEDRSRVAEVGRRIVSRSDAAGSPYRFSFTLLADPRTINAFALPGGPVFVTRALYDLLETEGELAGVLAHEVTHVLARHTSEQMAKQGLLQGVGGAVVIGSSDPGDPDATRRHAYAVGVASQLLQLSYGRGDELEADRLGVKWMSEAGYDPRSMVRVMEILEKSGPPGRGPDFLSTHPSPDRRIERIHEAIDALFPDGVPPGLER